MTQVAQILVFGDSITYGAWDKEGGWVQRLRKFLDKKTLAESETYSLVYNLGVSGGTTKYLLKRFEFEIRQRFREDRETIIIFAIGLNDSQFIHSQNSLQTPPERFKENIQELANLAQKFAQKIIFIGLTPVDESKMAPLPGNIGKSYKNENIQNYNEIIKLFCRENSLLFVEIFEHWIKMDYKNLLEDDFHPNSAGHQRIFETIKDFLVENKIIKP